MKYVYVLLLICISIFAGPSNILAKNGDNSNQQEFLVFEENVYELVVSALEPLNQLEELNGKGLYNMVVSEKQRYADTALTIAKLKIPTLLPNDIKVTLKQIKYDLSTGFELLGDSINTLQEYMDKGNPFLFDSFVEKHNKGVSYIAGGLTWLTTVRMQLYPLERGWDGKI